MALVEEPDYAKALLRKILILEKKGEFSQATSMAQFAVVRFDNEYEDERNMKVVPEFKEAINRMDGKLDTYKKANKKVLKDEVNKELGIKEGEESASGSFFADIDAYKAKYTRKHGDVEIDDVKEVDSED